MKGLQLLNNVNAIRACRGKPPIARISLCGTCPDDPLRCPVASVTGAAVSVGSHPLWLKRFVLRVADSEIARAIAGTIGQACAPDRPEVLAPDAIVSFVCAVHYGLAFEDADGFLKGWIEPTDNDPSVWDLHLMPGEPYPPGHAARPAADPAGEPLELLGGGEDAAACRRWDR